MREREKEKVNCYIVIILQDKSKLVTFVVSSGLQYGAGENLLHFLFKV